jgi:hypothetical protein
MAMDKDRLGAAIKAFIDSTNPNAGGLTAGEQSELLAFCTGIGECIIDEIKNHAQIDFQAADITVPSTGLISASPGAPVTGSAVNAVSAVAPGRIS